MPTHRFYIPAGLYTAEEKAALSAAITEQMYSMLPKFYVVVIFIEIPRGSLFVGGVANDQHVRIMVQHLAIHQGDDIEKKIKMIQRYQSVIDPWTKGKGVDWEITISEEDPTLWLENGLVPPALGTHDFGVWKSENKPSFSK